MTQAWRDPRRRRRVIWLGLAIAALLAYGAVGLVFLLNRDQAGSTGSTGAVVYAVGDMAGKTDGDSAVTAMLSRHNFDALLSLGDHAYELGSAEQFSDYYQPTYGVFDDRIRPTPGNHDYTTPGAAAYFDYFDRRSPSFSRRQYYAFRLGGWRIYSLNSEIGEGKPDSRMYEWLRNDLSQHPAACVLAFWHRPILTVGRKDNDEGDMALIWSMLATRGADVVLAGHDHNYQRWEPIEGITSFVVGTGGRSRYPIARDDDRLAVSDDKHYGALELRLRSGGASYAFRSADDEVLDAGEITCSEPVTDTARPPAPAALRAERPTDGVEHLTWDPPEDTEGIVGYVIQRGDEPIGFTADTAFDDESLPADASVLYSVHSVNAAGIRSPPSPMVHSGGDAIGFSGSVWSPVGTNPAGPTSDKPQSKLWFAHGTWWGALYTDGVADELPSGYYIHRFHAETQAWTNTGTAMDERDRSHADVLWDDASQRLYVVSAIDSGAIKLYRYGYANGEYSTDPGFPIRLTENGAESATIAMDSEDRLWVALTQAGDGTGLCVVEKACVVEVMHSTSADYRWTTPQALPVEGSEVTADDVAAVVAYGGRVGIAWSNQLDGSVRFATHVDGDDDSAWSVETLVVAPRASDDHLNVKADEAGRVYIVFKTSLNEPADAPGDAPLIAVWVRETDGVWRSGTAWTVADDVTRPQIVVDSTLGQVAVVAAAPGAGGTIYGKTAAIDSLAFEPGVGTPLMLGVKLNNPTTTKQAVDLRAGALVLAGDSGTHLYWHNTVSLTP